MTPGLMMNSIGWFMFITRGMPTGPQVNLGSNTSPALSLAMLASYTAWYSGVSGACCPRPGGLVGSQDPSGLPRSHMPSKAGYFLASCAPAARDRHSSAATATTELRWSMVFSRLSAAQRRAAPHDRDLHLLPE